MAVKEQAPVRDLSDAKGKKGKKDAEPEGKGKGGKKKLIIILVAVLALGGGGWFMFLKPKGPTPPPVPGEVVKLDPVNINLADGHFLKLGIALQAPTTAHEVPEGSAALDMAITLFTGRSVAELSQPKKVAELKEELLHQIEEHYEHSVMDIYFTSFVQQ